MNLFFCLCPFKGFLCRSLLILLLMISKCLWSSGRKNSWPDTKNAFASFFRMKEKVMSSLRRKFFRILFSLFLRCLVFSWILCLKFVVLRRSMKWILSLDHQGRVFTDCCLSRRLPLPCSSLSISWLLHEWLTDNEKEILCSDDWTAVWTTLDTLFSLLSCLFFAVNFLFFEQTAWVFSGQEKKQWFLFLFLRHRESLETEIESSECLMSVYISSRKYLGRRHESLVLRWGNNNEDNGSTVFQEWVTWKRRKEISRRPKEKGEEGQDDTIITSTRHSYSTWLLCCIR